MDAPVENETVFVRVDTAIGDVAVVREARVLHRVITRDEFDFMVVGAPGYGTRRIAEEGITWSRPEHADALRVTVALSS